MAKRKSKSKQVNAPPALVDHQALKQAIKDVDGLEKLQAMQLTMIRAIRRELGEFEKILGQSTSG